MGSSAGLDGIGTFHGLVAEKATLTLPAVVEVELVEPVEPEVAVVPDVLVEVPVEVVPVEAVPVEPLVLVL